MGGESQEREVSLRSGQAVYEALQDSSYEVMKLDFKSDAINQLIEIDPDVVFIALHGKNGEDGTVQGLLELLGKPYTGSGVAASAICMNKIISKKMFTFENIPTPEYQIIDKHFLDQADKNIDSLLEKIGLPMVIKAATQGSSIGTFIVRCREMIEKAIVDALVFDPEVLVEEFIDGVEITASVIGNEEALVLPLIEITSVNEFYDYESKYTPGMCSHIIPARIDDKIRREIETISKKTYEALGCRGFSRIDFIVDQLGNPYVLEVNTIPGMTDMSLVPDAARAAGMSFKQLVEYIVRLALDK
jgi:D-alanine-D-alanine ligase